MGKSLRIKKANRNTNYARKIKMKNILYRIGDLELRKTKNLKTEEYYLEIVQWYKNEKKEDYCFTILIFEKEKDGYSIKSVLDRIVIVKNYWSDLYILIKQGFDFLESEEDSA